MVLQSGEVFEDVSSMFLDDSSLFGKGFLKGIQPLLDDY